MIRHGTIASAALIIINIMNRLQINMIVTINFASAITVEVVVGAETVVIVEIVEIVVTAETVVIVEVVVTAEAVEVVVTAEVVEGADFGGQNEHPRILTTSVSMMCISAIYLFENVRFGASFRDVTLRWSRFR
jgi:hypothetical protein